MFVRSLDRQTPDAEFDPHDSMEFALGALGPAHPAARITLRHRLFVPLRRSKFHVIPSVNADQMPMEEILYLPGEGSVCTDHGLFLRCWFRVRPHSILAGLEGAGDITMEAAHGADHAGMRVQALDTGPVAAHLDLVRS